MGPLASLRGHGRLLLLAAVLAGIVYYLPGMKIEAAETAKPVTKRQSKFKVKHNALIFFY